MLQHEIKFITAAETHPLRKRVLRPLSTVDECVFDRDEEATTFHLGLFHAGRLVSIATFALQSHQDFDAGLPFRLRGMATDEKYRGQGFGGILLRRGIEELRARRCDLLWFNARVKAFDFYRDMGFYFHGDLFEIPGTGPHKVMYKRLIPR